MLGIVFDYDGNAWVLVDGLTLGLAMGDLEFAIYFCDTLFPLPL